MNLSLNYLLQLLIVYSSLGFILLASSLGKKILVKSHKILTGAAPSTTVYIQMKKSSGGSDSTSENDDDKKDNKKDADNKADTKDKKDSKDTSK